jgi:hypothetical protein
MALAPLAYRRPRGRAAVISDERDQLIRLRSLTAAWAVLWLFIVVACMGTWFLHRGGTIPADTLPIFIWAGLFVTTVSQSLVTVFQYRAMGS